MRMHRFLLALILLLQLNTYAQIDQRKVDSLARVIDSSANANQQQQEKAIKAVDSNYRSQLSKALRQNSRNKDNSLAEQKGREARQRQQTIVRILIGILLLIIGVVALVRRRKTKS